MPFNTSSVCAVGNAALPHPHQSFGFSASSVVLGQGRFGLPRGTPTPCPQALRVPELNSVSPLRTPRWESRREKTNGSAPGCERMSLSPLHTTAQVSLTGGDILHARSALARALMLAPFHQPSLSGACSVHGRQQGPSLRIAFRTEQVELPRRTEVRPGVGLAQNG